MLNAGSKGTRNRQSIVSVLMRNNAVFSRFAGALLRAILVVVMIATPSLIVPGTHFDTTQIVALLALVGAVFTFIEYNSTYPSLVEFRDAPPFNRVRFGALFLSVCALSIIVPGHSDPSTLTQIIHVIGYRLSELLDFPFSPVRLMVLMLPDRAPSELLIAVRTAAGVSYSISILSLSVFVLILRINKWPSSNRGFNIWINLPMFDPTVGGNIVQRLQRDAQINLVLGFLLPFLLPAVFKLTAALFSPINLASPHTMIWTITAWAILPSFLFMRGIAMNRVARMIEEKRKQQSEESELEPVYSHV